MHIHTAIFGLYIFAAFLDNFSLWYAELRINSYSECRFYIMQFTFNELNRVANCVLIILFAYMSIRYSQPMKTYWSNIASQQNELQSSAQNSERSFSRANETTIEILQALVRTQENIDVSYATNDLKTDQMDEDSD